MTRIAPETRAAAKRLRIDATPQERKLWAKLREVNQMIGTHFRRQAPIGPFIADFADLGRRLVIEADGSGHGGASDNGRDAWLDAQGFTVLRFWNNDIDSNIDGVMQMVLDAIGGAPLASAPPPQPSPTRGEGGAFHAALRGTPDQITSPPPRGEGLGVGGRMPKGPTP